MYQSLEHSRFTVCGSRLLDEQIKRDLKYIVKFLLDHQPAASGQLVAIWLGGSYGRREGAVFREEKYEKPWFDYDIFLFYEQLQEEATLYRKYRIWENQLSKKLGQSVDLKAVCDLESRHQLPPRLIWFDLLQGHQVLWQQQVINPELKAKRQLPPQTALSLLLYWGGAPFTVIAPTIAVTPCGECHRYLVSHRPGSG